jgi:hypothetical protein
VNSEYLLWFALLVIVAGAALLWLAIGDVPEIPPEAEPDDPEEPASELAGEDGVAESA